MSDSQPMELPKFIKWSTPMIYDYSSQVVDYETLEELGTAINAARAALFKVTDQINKYERDERLAKMHYDREYRRTYLAATDKTESLKRMRAELACEDLENEYVVHEQMKLELVRTSHALRLELQTLQAIGNNLRQQMKME